MLCQARQSLTATSPATSTRIARTAHESPVVAAIAIAATAMTAASTLVAMVIDPFRVPPSIAPLLVHGYVGLGSSEPRQTDESPSTDPLLIRALGHRGPRRTASRRSSRGTRGGPRDVRLKDPGELGEEQHAVMGRVLSTYLEAHDPLTGLGQ
jgi:hypothetical protein